MDNSKGLDETRLTLSLPKISDKNRSMSLPRRSGRKTNRSASEKIKQSSVPNRPSEDEPDAITKELKFLTASGTGRLRATPSLVAALSISRLTPEAKKVVTQLNVLSKMTRGNSEIEEIDSVQKASQRLLQKIKGINRNLDHVSPAAKKLKLVYERVKKVFFPKIRMKELFKKCVRLIIYQLNILAMITKKHKSGDTLEIQAMKEFVWYAKNPFNKEYYAKRFHVTLSKKLMLIMSKEPEDRTAADIDLVKHFLGEMNIRPILHLMNGRSQAVKNDFARILRFARIEAGRVIVRQGHSATNIYMLMKGEVAVLYTNHDKIKGTTKANVVALERDGYDFGVGVEGFHDTRLNTVVAKEDCDIVWIDKTDYEEVIDIIDDKDRNTSIQFIQQVLPSTTHDELALQLCLRHCVYQEYPPDTEIKVNECLDADGRSKYVFFVYNGICLQYRTLYLRKWRDHYGNNIISLDKQKHKHAAVGSNEHSGGESNINLKLPAIGKQGNSHVNEIASTHRHKTLHNLTTRRLFSHADAGRISKDVRHTGSLPTYLNKAVSMQRQREKGRMSHGGSKAKSVTFHIPPFSLPAEKTAFDDAGKDNSANEESYNVTKLSKLINRMEYFGVGETHKNSVYMTPKGKPTEFIVIPRDAFESKSTLNQQLSTMANKLMDERQTSPELYREYKKEQDWINYKKSLLSEIVCRPKCVKLAKHLGHVNPAVETTTDHRRTTYLSK